ncbi:Protein of unknown function [Gryllus bimaculatus]|nr:Protein of unknown function [Gryllus bimaculatus]
MTFPSRVQLLQLFGIFLARKGEHNSSAVVGGKRQLLQQGGQQRSKVNASPEGTDTQEEQHAEANWSITNNASQINNELSVRPDCEPRTAGRDEEGGFAVADGNIQFTFEKN